MQNTTNKYPFSVSTYYSLEMAWNAFGHGEFTALELSKYNPFYTRTASVYKHCRILLEYGLLAAFWPEGVPNTARNVRKLRITENGIALVRRMTEKRREIDGI